MAQEVELAMGEQVKLPDGWLDDPDEFATISIDDAISGG
jgi:hypothetical protein